MATDQRSIAVLAYDVIGWGEGETSSLHTSKGWGNIFLLRAGNASDQ